MIPVSFASSAPEESPPRVMSEEGALFHPSKEKKRTALGRKVCLRSHFEIQMMKDERTKLGKDLRKVRGSDSQGVIDTCNGNVSLVQKL
jgi:hypothetical protein